MNRFISKIGSEFVDLLYPIPCAGCGTYGEGPLCTTCARGVTSRTVNRELLKIEASTGKSCLVEVKAAGIYEGTMKKLILELKASYKVYAKPLALLMIARVGNDGGYLSADRIYYVPGTADKTRERGYNQARLLAEYIAAHFGLPLTHSLIKTRRTVDQDGLTGKERWLNVENVFKVEEGLQSCGKAILVDDVLTTGATSSNCARALLTSGVEDVMVLVGGRAMLRGRRIP